MNRPLSLLALTAFVALVAAAPAASRPSTMAATTVINVKATDFAFALSKKSVRRGTTVVFKVTNAGTATHDFKIAGKKTPLLEAGGTARLRVVFKKAGRYPFVCTVPGHKEAGMKGIFIVR